MNKVSVEKCNEYNPITKCIHADPARLVHPLLLTTTYTTYTPSRGTVVPIK